MNFLRAHGKISDRIKKNFNPNGKCLNLASGEDYRKGWINADLYAPKADIRFNLEKLPWPIEDKTLDYIYADQILEHLPDRIGTQDGVLAILGEMNRILKLNGRIYIGVPHMKDSLMWENPTHRRGFIPETLNTLDYVNGDETVKYQAGYCFRVLDTILLKRLRITKIFDSSYHIPKYFKTYWNIGKSWGIVWILEKW